MVISYQSFQRYVALAKEILQRGENLVQEMQVVAGSHSGRLRLGIPREGRPTCCC